MAGKVFFICSCGMSNLVPADSKFFYCWNCKKQWPRNPRAGRPVQYGKDRPKRVYRAWPERNRYYPRPQQPRYVPRTPPTKIQPANFHMSEPPVGPVLGAPPAVAAPAVAAATTAKAGMGVGSVLTIIFSIVVLVVAVTFLVNPSAFVDKVESILASSNSSSSSSSSSSSESCAQVRQYFTSISNCTSSGYGCNKPGYSFCEAKLRNPQCRTMNGVQLCDTDWQQVCIPNKCIP